MDIPIALPADALVLVTNGTQPIQLQVIKQLLQRGCRVRTTTNSNEAGYWLDNQFQMDKHSGRFEHVKLVLNVDSGKPLYQEVVKDVFAIVHTPTLISLTSPPKVVWAVAAESVLSMLDTAKAEKSVQALVYTSSILAVTPLMPDGERLVTENSWNAKDAILAMSGQHDEHHVRSSALTYAEQALWQWVNKHSPAFKVNVVCPANLIGQNYAPEHTSDWKNWIFELYQTGKAREVIPGAGPTQAREFSGSPHFSCFDELLTLEGADWYVDAADVALLHIAAIFDPEIENDRLQAWGCHRDWNDAIAVLRNLGPGNPDVTLPFFIGHDGVQRGRLYTRFARVSDILKRWNGAGWKPFESTIAESVETFQQMGNHVMGGIKG